MSKFTKEEIEAIFDTANEIENAINTRDFSNVFNALLVVLANGGQTVSKAVSKDDYMKMINTNIGAWWKMLDDFSAMDADAENALIEQFKRTDWYFNYGEGNGYYEGKESYEKTMRMVTDMGERGLELMEKYLAEHGIKP